MQLILLKSITTDIEFVSRELLTLNQKTERYGLILTPEDAKDLAEVRAQALRDNERVEVGIGTPELIAEVFSKSSYAEKQSWPSLLCELCELFYDIKTRLDDKISDRELAAVLFYFFEGNCNGSIELMQSRELEFFLRDYYRGSYTPKNVRNEYDPDPYYEPELDDRIGRLRNEFEREEPITGYELSDDDDYSILYDEI